MDLLRHRIRCFAYFGFLYNFSFFFFLLNCNEYTLRYVYVFKTDDVVIVLLLFFFSYGVHRTYFYGIKKKTNTIPILLDVLSDVYCMSLIRKNNSSLITSLLDALSNVYYMSFIRKNNSSLITRCVSVWAQCARV